MRGLDLGLFQFDWDTTWAAMFLNADGTIYARYGTRNSDRKGSGDVIDTFDGQAVASTADIQWVLQNASDKADFKVGVTRGSEAKSLTVSVSGPWKRYDISWRESLWDLRSGLALVPLSDDERKKAAIAEKALGLKAKFVAPQGNAKKAGFQQDDIVVEVDGKSAAMTEGDLLGYLRQKFAPGAKVPMTVLRGGKKVKLTLELN